MASMLELFCAMTFARYTGSDSWLYRVGLEAILGFHKRGYRVRIGAPASRRIGRATSLPTAPRSTISSWRTQQARVAACVPLR
jgi:hypothetical protein